MRQSSRSTFSLHFCSSNSTSRHQARQNRFLRQSLRCWIRIAFIILFCCSYISFAQPEQVCGDSAQVNQLFDKGRTFETVSKYDSCLYYYDLALSCLESFKAASSDQFLWSRYVQVNIRKANLLRIMGKIDDAVVISSKSLAEAEQHLTESDPVLSRTYEIHGLVLWQQSELDSALSYQYKGLDLRLKHRGRMHITTASSYNNLGIIYWKMGKLDDGGASHREALAIRLELLGNDHRHTGVSYSNIGLIEMERGDYEQALKYLNRAYEIALNTNYLELEIAALQNRSIIYDAKKDFARSIQQNRLLAERVKQFYGEYHVTLAELNNNIGAAQVAQFQYRKAMESIRTAKQILDTLNLGQDPLMHNVLGGLANCHSQLGNHEEAVDYYQQTIDFLAMYFPDRHADLGRQYMNISRIHTQLKQHEIARSHVEKGLRNFRQAFGDYHPFVAEGYRGLANDYLIQEKYTEALAAAQKGIVSVAPGFANLDVRTNPDHSRVLSKSTYAKLLGAKGKALVERYRDTGEIDDLKLSIDCYEHTLATIENLHGDIRNLSSLQTSLAFFAKAYVIAIETVALATPPSADIDWRELSFRVSEQAKANILWQSMLESRARIFAGIPDSLLAREESLREEMTQTQLPLKQARAAQTISETASNIDSLEIAYALLKSQHDDLIEALNRDYPRFAELQGRSEIPTAAAISDMLNGQTAVISYFVADSSILIFGIADNQDLAYRMIKPANFQDMVSDFKAGIKKQDHMLTNKTAPELYKLLLAPLSSLWGKRKHLYIIPHAGLHGLPFEALFPRAVKIGEKPDYLVRNYGISYHYSARMLVDHLQSEEIKYPSPYIGFAPVFMPDSKSSWISPDKLQDILWMPADADATKVFRSSDGKRFDALPWSREEVLSAARILNATDNAFIDGEATEARFKALADNHKIVHIATHGVLNVVDPALSNLVFAATDSLDLSEDGYFFAREAFAHNFRTDLLVLSACNTGSGNIQRGEGVMALNRGFLYSGAQNILSSLWAVSDRSTHDLVLRFYQEMNSGKTYTEALRLAKLSLLESSDYAEPYYWSGFTLLGG